MSRADEFLASYHRIEDYMVRALGDGQHYSFSNMVNRLSVSNPIIDHYKEDLHQFGQLRNAIVHERREPDFIIAEPHESIVELIEEIERELLHPKTVSQLFAKTVSTFLTTDMLIDVLERIREESYSHFPIYYPNGKFRGLLTKTGITYWLAIVSSSEFISLKHVTVGQVIHHDHHVSRYVFVRSDASLIEAAHHFAMLSRGAELDVILITEHGKPSDPLLGIVRPIDILAQIE